MQLTPHDKTILRHAVVHGRYRPQRAGDFLRCFRLVEIMLLAETDNAPGVYTATRLGEQLHEAMSETV